MQLPYRRLGSACTLDRHMLRYTQQHVVESHSPGNFDGTSASEPTIPLLGHCVNSAVWRSFDMERIKAMRNTFVTSDPTIMMGKPVITGTRITVESILDRFAAGETLDQMLEAHPRLTKEAIFAAFAFAADTLRSDVIYPISEKAA